MGISDMGTVSHTKINDELLTSQLLTTYD